MFVQLQSTCTEEKRFTVPDEVARRSVTLNNMLNHCSRTEDNVITIPSRSEVLEQVVAWLESHDEEREEMTEEDRRFFEVSHSYYILDI